MKRAQALYGSAPVPAEIFFCNHQDKAASLNPRVAYCIFVASVVIPCIESIVSTCINHAVTLSLVLPWKIGICTDGRGIFAPSVGVAVALVFKVVTRVPIASIICWEVIASSLLI